MSLSPEDRVEYVNTVLENLAESLRDIANQEGIMEKIQLVDQFFKELNDKAATLQPPIVYAIKPDFQQTFQKFLKEFSSMV